MNEYIEKIHQRIEPVRQQINNHRIYAVIGDVEDPRLFMQYHVYAAGTSCRCSKPCRTT
jgi:hypothetical protein